MIYLSVHGESGARNIGYIAKGKDVSQGLGVEMHVNG